MEAFVAELLDRWRVEQHGAVVVTHTSTLVPGMRDGAPVMLKVADEPEEVRGGALLQWWAGDGAVPVLERDGGALLMRRATGPRDLVDLAEVDDAAATAVLVAAAAALHRRPPPRPEEAVGLVPLAIWFAGLLEREQIDGDLAGAARVAGHLLETTEAADVVALHGDLHHGNVLDLGDRWAAIDPKGLLGHRSFDLANLFCNPSTDLAVRRLDERLALVARLADLDEAVLGAWVVAWCGLSLSWSPAPHARTWHDRAARVVLERLLPRVLPAVTPG